MEDWIQIIIVSVFALSITQASASACSTLKNCTDCIQEPQCVWCSNPFYPGLHCYNSSIASMCFSPTIDASQKDLGTNKCPCDLNPENNSQDCNSKGTLQCGVCTCNPGYSGRHCNCQLPVDQKVISEYESTCKATNDSRICSGRGTCVCGKCECDQNENPNENYYVYGLFCECDDFSCDRNVNGILCGNSSLECRCGKCVEREPKILEPLQGVQMSAVHMSVFRSIKKLDRK